MGCPVFRMMPAKLKEHAEESPHLLEYLHILPVEKVGIPKYYDKLDRKLKDVKNPNLIYPIHGGLYVHIYPDTSTSRNSYIAIEPGMMEDLDSIISSIEYQLVDFVHELEQADSIEEQRETLLGAMDRVVTIDQNADGHGGGGDATAPTPRFRIPFLKPKTSGAGVLLTPDQINSVRYRIVRDKVGMGILEPLLLDPNIEDISCAGLGNIFLEHKIFDSLKSNLVFHTTEQLDTFVIRMSEKINRPVTYREPVVDATLPDGSRINIVYGTDVSRRGSNFTIRKFAEDPLSIITLIEFGSINFQMAAYLSLAMRHGLNMFVSGETASGKTTLINALTAFIPPNDKIVSIEDTPELQIPHPNWLREVTRGSSKNEDSSAVGMFDLLKAALRQRPNMIIIGEIRGEEGAIAFQAMQTGHTAMATFHASTVEKLIQRLTGAPINIPKNYVDNLNLVVIQSAVQLPDGRPGRRLVSINEIIGYDPTTEGFAFIEVFRWNPATDEFEFPGYMNSFMLENRIATARGITPAKKRQIYTELDRRTRILERLHKQGVKGFQETYDVLAQAYRQGLFR